MLLALPFAALESNRPCSDIFPIYGWVQKYWTTLVEIKLTDVNFPNFPGCVWALDGAAIATRQVKGVCEPSRRIDSEYAGRGVRDVDILVAIVLPG
jgi:hypothetical protein